MSLSDEYLKIMFSFHTHIEKIKLFCARKEVKLGELDDCMNFLTSDMMAE